MKLDILDDLKDEELQVAIDHAQALLKRRDEERKAKALSDARALQAKALSDARALLASVGLTIKDLPGKAKGRMAKGPTYHAGHLYQHPANKALTWNAKGQKPRWLRELEAEGKAAIEAARPDSHA